MGITEFHLVIQTLQDTNTWHLQQGSLDVCEFYLVLGILADKSEEALVKWCHLLNHSFRYFKSAGRSVLKRVTIPQQTHSYLRRKWKCYNSVHTRCSYLCFLICNTALKQQKSLELPNCFFPNLNSIATGVLRWFTAPPPTPLKALGIAGLATHGRNKLVQGASADPTLSFVPFLQSPALDDQLFRFATLLQQNQALSLFSTETGKTLCKSLFFWEAEHWTKTRLTNVPHQNKVWQANSYLGTCALRPIHL